MTPTVAKIGAIGVYAVILYGAILSLPVLSNAHIFFVITVVGLGLGIATQLIFDWHGTRPYWTVFLNAVAAFALISAVLALFALETLICLAIAAPIIFVGVALGLLITRTLIAHVENRSLHCTILLVLPLVVSPLDPSALKHARVYAVSNTLDIRASVTDLRRLTQNVPTISDADRPWTFTHNILRAPRPLSAETRDGVRFAAWEQGVRFQEILDNPQDLNTLTWSFHFPDPTLLHPLDIHVSPVGPDVTLLTGGYVFEPLPNGQTRVTLTTTYRLNTVMNAYLALWGQQFLSDFHIAVLHVIANRAEAL